MASSEETIATPDGTLRVRVLRPRAVRAGEAMPAVIYFHGGGFFAGGIDETDELARTIAKRTDSIVVNVDYHLAPEARFPVAVKRLRTRRCAGSRRNPTSIRTGSWSRARAPAAT